MLNQIPKSRLLIYAMIAGFIPVVFAFTHLVAEFNTVSTLLQRLPAAQNSALITEGKLSQNRIVRAHFADADHFYIDKHLESLSFLEDEVEALTRLTESTAYGNHQAVQRRIDFLTGQDNHLVFTEGVVQSYPGFQETQESLIHPVEMNGEDLKKLLARLEGLAIGSYEAPDNRPQLIITDLKLEKKSTFANNEVFLVNLRLLKREYL